MNPIRINKYLADMGIMARRKVDKMIEDGKINVNGEKARLGQIVNPEEDLIEVEGKDIKKEKKTNVYYVLNKPQKVLCAVEDKYTKRVLVTDIVKSEYRIFPIGRLDYETEGLILLTNDGELFNKIIHPKSEVYKTYYVEVHGKIDNEKKKMLENGIELKDGLTLPAIVNIIEVNEENTKLKIKIREGRNRQIRRMFTHIGNEVLYLKREAIGEMMLGSLKTGEYRELTEKEVEYLYNL